MRIKNNNNKETGFHIVGGLPTLHNPCMSLSNLDSQHSEGAGVHFGETPLVTWWMLPRQVSPSPM